MNNIAYNIEFILRSNHQKQDIKTLNLFPVSTGIFLKQSLWCDVIPYTEMTPSTSWKREVSNLLPRRLTINFNAVHQEVFKKSPKLSYFIGCNIGGDDKLRHNLLWNSIPMSRQLKNVGFSDNFILK